MAFLFRPTERRFTANRDPLTATTSRRELSCLAPALFSPARMERGVISSSNNLNGDIIVNNNSGQVDLLNPITKAVTIIAMGGSRGDYASPDTNNGTLFLDYADVVGRLSCGADCSIGGPPPSTPEPASLILLGTGLAALAGFKKRRKLNQA